jgi:nitroreductase
VTVAAARPAERFGPPGIGEGSLEEAIRAASRGVAPLLAVVTSSTALRRLRAAAHASQRPALAAATAAVVPCLRASDGVHEGASLRVGAAIGRLTVALRAQGIGWAWDAEAPLDAELARAALDLAEGWRPVAVVAVGPTPEGGAAPRPRPPA